MTGETAGCWNFPENNSGQARGIADAGMATFQGNRIGALAREICQNSLDALKDGEDGVTVTFAWRSVPKKRMPDMLPLNERWKMLRPFGIRRQARILKIS